MYYNTNEVASLLGFTIETVRRKIHNGEISSIKVRDKHKIPKEEVRNYLLSMVKSDVSEEEKNKIVSDILNNHK